MLRKISTLGALVVVAVSFGVANASATPKKAGQPPASHGPTGPSASNGHGTDGFSDGRD